MTEAASGDVAPPRSDRVAVIERHDEDVPITLVTGMRGIDHDACHVVGSLVSDNHLDRAHRSQHGIGQSSPRAHPRVRAAASHFGDRHSWYADGVERHSDLVHLVLAYDPAYQFHGESSEAYR